MAYQTPGGYMALGLKTMDVDQRPSTWADGMTMRFSDHCGGVALTATPGVSQAG
ncbi:hypothetical protein VSX61_17510 [Brenneria populi subsp. brevivirga]|nr:hypothetical protein [Brenneria populi subsp. brevivirga]